MFLWGSPGLIFLWRYLVQNFEGEYSGIVLNVDAKEHIAVLNDSTKARCKIFMTLGAENMIPCRFEKVETVKLPEVKVLKGLGKYRIYYRPGPKKCGFLEKPPGLLKLSNLSGDPKSQNLHLPREKMHPGCGVDPNGIVPISKQNERRDAMKDPGFLGTQSA